MREICEREPRVTLPTVNGRRWKVAELPKQRVSATRDMSGPKGLLASSTRKANITKIRALLCVRRPEQAAASGPDAEIIPRTLREPCPCCGGPMRVIEIFRRGQKPMSRAPPREQAA